MTDGPDPLGRLFGIADDYNDDDAEYTDEDGDSGDVKGGGSATTPEEVAAELPPNLQNWVEEMVNQADEVDYRSVLLSDAFRKFAEGYGYDVAELQDELRI